LIAEHHTRVAAHDKRADDFTFAVEAERRLLALGFLQPDQLDDIGFRLGLRSDDFTWIGYGFLYTYVCLCGEQGITPTVEECVQLAAANSVELTARQLNDILFNTDIRDGELVNYAHDVLRASQRRSEALFRDLVRDTIRAVNRGLRLDAEQHAKLHGDDPLSRHSPRNGRDKRRPCERSPLFRVGGST